MRGKHLAVAVAFSLMIVGAGLVQLQPKVFASADPSGAEQTNMLGPTDQGVPSYHAYALRPPFPATLNPKQFSDALNRNVYALAAKIKPVLFQQPCYCYCDRSDGHKSLLDCFAGTHGSECDICQKEAILAYQLTRKGKTPVQIRAAIIHGDWKSVDLNRYSKSAAAR